VCLGCRRVAVCVFLCVVLAPRPLGVCALGLCVCVWLVRACARRCVSLCCRRCGLLGSGVGGSGSPLSSGRLFEACLVLPLWGMGSSPRQRVGSCVCVGVCTACGPPRLVGCTHRRSPRLLGAMRHHGTAEAGWGRWGAGVAGTWGLIVAYGELQAHVAAPRPTCSQHPPLFSRQARSGG
jgi:hypothetical protein